MFTRILSHEVLYHGLLAKKTKQVTQDGDKQPKRRYSELLQPTQNSGRARCSLFAVYFRVMTVLYRRTQRSATFPCTTRTTTVGRCGACIRRLHMLNIPPRHSGLARRAGCESMVPLLAYPQCCVRMRTVCCLMFYLHIFLYQALRQGQKLACCSPGTSISPSTALGFLGSNFGLANVLNCPVGRSIVTPANPPPLRRRVCMRSDRSRSWQKWMSGGLPPSSSLKSLLLSVEGRKNVDTGSGMPRRHAKVAISTQG